MAAESFILACMTIGGHEEDTDKVEMTLMPMKTAVLPPTNALGHALLWTEIVTGVIRAPTYLECAMKHAIRCGNPTCRAVILPGVWIALCPSVLALDRCR